MKVQRVAFRGEKEKIVDTVVSSFVKGLLLIS